MRTLLVDNYDSFTFNLFQALAGVNGVEPIVVRNDQLTLEEVRALDLDSIVLSPGPGRPDRAADFGVCGDILRAAEVPVLGVCLGCQGLGSVYGARVVAAPEPRHGRVSAIQHDGGDLFAGIPQGFAAVRYHSLMVAEPLPEGLRRTAWTADGVIMGLRHTAKPLWGVQFHPESIGTAHGRALLQNFRHLAERHWRAGPRSKRDVHVAGGAVTVVPHRTLQPAVETGRAVRWRRLPLAATSETLFAGLFGEARYAAWLDSSREGEGGGRFSFMGAPGDAADVWLYDVRQRSLRAGDGRALVEGPVDLFDALKRELAVRAAVPADLPFAFQGGPVGYLGYELKALCGAGPNAHVSPHPDAALLWLERFLAVDHAERALYLVCVERPGGTAEQADAWFDGMARRIAWLRPAGTAPRSDAATAGPAAARASRTEQQYRVDVATCRQLIAEGESYEICLTDNLHVAADVDPARLHAVLRRRNPAPYAALLRCGEFAVVSSSPERFLSIGRDRVVEARPIKGTMRRGATAAEDEALREALRTSEKNRAENLMIVDLMRHDLGIVCEPGSVAVPALMAVETYATVHQMVSTVRGRLRADVDAVDCVRHAFPAGSMTGAPKRRTMEILDHLEREARGIYSGAIGWFSHAGAVDLGVVIRTAVVAPGHVTVGTGGAVTALSDAEDEIREMRLKADVMLRAIAEAV